MSARDLLVEIGTEELPPKALRRLSTAFLEGIVKGLDDAALSHGKAVPFATPRRLAVRVPSVALTQPDRQMERRGPALQAAFDADGNPTRAAEGFARSCGVTVAELERLESDKGAWLVWRSVQKGQPAAELIPHIVRAALDGLPIPKRMRWGDLDAQFVRPVHWAVVLLGDQVVETELLAVTSGRATRGHRFHHPAALDVPDAAAYEGLLREARVVASFKERCETIRTLAEQAGREAGGRAVIDEALLEEVAAMVEWPVAVTGRFEERFLQVPQEALISTMKANQKYFHVVDGEGRLLPRFITIANIESRDPDVVREGNERVIRPRLADAEFFWNQDRKQPLDAHVERLATILFQQKLGTLHDKAARVEHLATWIAARIGGDETWARRAAWLAKCDLMTEMVYEFPELQGIMGRYYAAADGEPEEVSRAMEEQYLPRFAGDRLPGTRTGQALAVADKLDTVCGLFAICQPPTGSKDPFALRRNALGALRILIEGGLDIDLESLLEEARQALGERVETDDLTGQVFDFMMERLRAWYHDQGVAPDSFEAVLARRPTRPLDFHHRLLAVSHFRSLPEAEALAAANKRIANILRQAREKGIDFPERVETARLESEPERDLAEAVERLGQEVGPLAEAGEYEPALGRLASLREVVDRFFDQVMVMVDDPLLRGNRLALLARLQALFLRVADISRLQA